MAGRDPGVDELKLGSVQVTWSLYTRRRNDALGLAIGVHVLTPMRHS
jgi:hypothetical protein